MATSCSVGESSNRNLRLLDKRKCARFAFVCMRNVRWPVVKDAHDFLQIITTEDIQATVEICDYNLPISRIPHNGIFGIGESVLLVCYRLAESLFSN